MGAFYFFRTMRCFNCGCDGVRVFREYRWSGARICNMSGAIVALQMFIGNDRHPMICFFQRSFVVRRVVPNHVCLGSQLSTI